MTESENQPEMDPSLLQPSYKKSAGTAAAKRNSTIVSVIIHAIIILIGLYVVVFQSTPKEEVAFIPPDPQRPRLEPRKLEMKVRVNQLTKRSSRPKLQPRMMVNAPSDLSLPEIKKNPKATKTKVQRNFSTMGTSGFGAGVGGGYGTGMGGGMGGMGLPPSVADRCSAANRSQRMRKSGGRAASEKAVQNALAWLQTQQNNDGSFGDKDQVAMTGLAILAYLGHCETPDSPVYGETVEKALAFIMSYAGTGKGHKGLISDSGGNHASYTHGIATYALGEAYIMTGDPLYRDPFLTGVQKVLEGQAPDGGWMYGMDGKDVPSDTSVSGWQIQALKSAYLAGLDEVAEDVEKALDEAVENIKRVHTDKGAFGYRNGGSGDTLTGVGVFTLTMWKNGKSREARRGTEFIMARTDEDNNSKLTDKGGDLIYTAANLYGMYYDVQAMFAQGGRDWSKYNDWFQKSLSDAQLEDGSWTPTANGKLHHGGDDTPSGKIYRTAVNTLMLEVYYRYLPVVDM
jgi:hypothetical protein